MEVLHSGGEKKGQFYIVTMEKPVARMVYLWSGDKFIIEHTEVDASLKGQGAGKKLLLAAVEFARKKGVKILPLCPFAKAVFERTPEYSDVLY